ncbi:MAG: ATP-binding protein [Desulfatiglandales bacterium]
MTSDMGRLSIQDEEKIRLLLVDDEDDFRRTIAKRLKKRGILPEEAGSGEECLALLEKNAMDIVVLDVKMPGMNGIEVLRRIKAAHAKTEVILLTGYATTHDGVEGIKAGAFDYLSKPIELEHLIGKIRQAHDKILRENEKLRELEYRARLEQQMIATERLASLGTLAAGVAHEINNPLAIIHEAVGWMQLLLQKKELEDMPRKGDFELALGKIKNGIDRARKITHQLLGFVKKTDSQFSEVDLEELAHEAIVLVKMESGNRQLGLTRDKNLDSISLFSDPYQLRQVLINLLSNAIHATGENGKIDVLLESAGDRVSLSVVDDGEGIPKENREKIFEPFFSTKAPGEGTGLGLFVTRGIVEKLGGKIDVVSRLGQGTTFRIGLPRSCKEKEVLGHSPGEDWESLYKGQ